MTAIKRLLRGEGQHRGISAPEWHLGLWITAPSALPVTRHLVGMPVATVNMVPGAQCR